MATAPRPKGKAKKIAEKIMGKSANRQARSKDSKLKKALLADETQRVR